MRSTMSLWLLVILAGMLAFGCGREAGKTIYVPVSQAPLDTESTPGESDANHLASKVAVQDASDEDSSVSNPSLAVSGGVIDSSGGSLVYATEAQVRTLVATLPEKLYALFYRINLVHEFPESLSPERDEDSSPKQPNSLLGQILQDLLMGNSQQEIGILSVLTKGGLSFHLNDKPCFEGDTHRDASINEQGEICLSLRRLTELPADVLEKQILSLIAHEIAHYYGYDENQAIFLQMTFLEERSFIIGPSTAMAMLKSIQEPLALAQQLQETPPLDLDDAQLCRQIINIPVTMTKRFYQFSEQVFLPSALHDTFRVYLDWTTLIPECVGYGASGFALPSFAHQKLLLRTVVEVLDDLQDLQLQMIRYLNGVSTAILDYADPAITPLKNYLGSHFLAEAISGKPMDKIKDSQLHCALYEQTLNADGLPEVQKLQTSNLATGLWRADTNTFSIAVSILSTPLEWAGTLLDVDIALPIPVGNASHQWEMTDKSSFQVGAARFQSILLPSYNNSFYIKIPTTENAVNYFGCAIRRTET